VLELGYRLLGTLLQARRLLVAGTTLGALVGCLVLVHEAAREPTAQAVLGALAMPLLLGVAAWWLFQLPPGVVFRRAAPVADPRPQATARCYASAYFDGARKTEWRLLARSSFALAPDGSLVLISPPALRASPAEVRQAFPSRGQPTAAQLQAGERARYPEWVYQPEALVGGPSRLVYQSAADYERAVARLAVAREALVDVEPGWQYAGLRRWPAIRVAYRGADGALVTAYVAFAEPAQRAWALAGLVGRRP
jgi:hypothetical protein